MTRIVIHAGFHKTGTTSVQSTLRENLSLLSRHARVFLKPDFEDLTLACRTFSEHPSEKALRGVSREAADFFATLEPADRRPILMSSEDLSGLLPGRRGLDRYDAAPLIMSQLADAAREAFGADVDLVFYFSTRERSAWLRSVWWQNLRSTRLAEDLDAFSATIAAAADLNAVLAEIAEAVAPAPATVAALTLEESSRQEFGPATPILKLVGLPASLAADLVVPAPENRLPELGLETVFLALNRSGLNDKHLSEAKRHLRKMANRQLGMR